jgi:hypothetical protein
MCPVDSLVPVCVWILLRKVAKKLDAVKIFQQQKIIRPVKQFKLHNKSQPPPPHPSAIFRNLCLLFKYRYQEIVCFFKTINLLTKDGEKKFKNAGSLLILVDFYVKDTGSAPQ